MHRLPVSAGGTGASSLTGYIKGNGSSAFSASPTIPASVLTGALPALDASALTNLNASNLASGTVPAARMPALTGDVTTTAGTVATTIANGAVTFAKIQNIASMRVVGRTAAGSGPASEIVLDAAASANSVALRDASGYLNAVYYNASNGDDASAASHYIYMNASDGYYRRKTLANVKDEIVTEAAIKTALATSADLQDTNELLLKQNCNIRASGGGAGTLYSTDVRDSTTAAAANVYIDPTGGFIQRSTSSRRYKKNIRRAKFGLGEVMKLRPVTYQGKGKLDGAKVHGGLIAEEVDAAGLPEFVVYRNGVPDSLAYGNMVALAFAAIQELNEEVKRLKEQLSRRPPAKPTKGQKP